MQPTSDNVNLLYTLQELTARECESTFIHLSSQLSKPEYIQKLDVAQLGILMHNMLQLKSWKSNQLKEVAKHLYGMIEKNGCPNSNFLAIVFIDFSKSHSFTMDQQE